MVQKRATIRRTVDFLLVIPAYHESLRLPSFLKQLLTELTHVHYKCRVLVVDDGSSAIEQQKLRDLVRDSSAMESVDTVFLSKNVGKGGAVRAGWEQAESANCLAFVDADGAIEPREICRLLDEAYHSTEDCAIFGSRVKMLGKTVERTFLRHLTGRIFAFLVGILITPKIYDSQCGLKIIPAACYGKIKSHLRETGFCFDVELLAALLDVGVTIREIPIDWRDKAGSKVSIGRDTMRLFLGLCRIRRRRASWTL